MFGKVAILLYIPLCDILDETIIGVAILSTYVFVTVSKKNTNKTHIVIPPTEDKAIKGKYSRELSTANTSGTWCYQKET